MKYQHMKIHLKANNETFHIFSQSDHDDDEQPPLKKMNTKFKIIK